MKKSIIMILVLTISAAMIIGGISAIAAKSKVSENTDIVEIRDYTTPWNAKTKAETINSGSVSMIAPFANDAEKIQKNGSVVIRGKVVATELVFRGSTVYTKSTLQIEECFKGDFLVGDTIFVREMGGFVSSAVYAEKICEEKGFEYTGQKDIEILDLRIENYKVLEKGEEVIMFLMPVAYTDIEEFSEKCYDSMRMWQGKLLYDAETQLFTPYIPEYEEKDVECVAYTAEQFREFVKAVIV